MTMSFKYLHISCKKGQIMNSLMNFMKTIKITIAQFPYEYSEFPILSSTYLRLYTPPQHLFNVNLVYLIKNSCNLYSEEVEFGVTKWCGYIAKYSYTLIHLYILN